MVERRISKAKVGVSYRRARREQKAVDSQDNQAILLSKKANNNPLAVRTHSS